MTGIKSFLTVITLLISILPIYLSANPYDMINEPPFLQGGCLIPKPLSLEGVEIQAKINVKANGKVSYKIMEPKTNKNPRENKNPDKIADAKKILDEIIKCPISIGTEKKRTPDGNEPAYYADDFFNFAFKPVSLDDKKGLTRCMKPVYHRKALSLGEQGVTLLQYKIDSATNTPAIQISRSSNSPRLDEASIEHMKNCLSYNIVKSEIPKNEWQTRAYNWSISDQSYVPRSMR